jgi:Tfp pilus assembly protein PilV
MRRTGATGADGFSLIEALLAGGLLSVGVLSLVPLLVVAIGAVREAARITVASTLAAQKIEELRAGPLVLAGEGRDRVEGYARVWRVTPLPEDPLGTAVIELRVTPGNVTLVTVRTARAP